MVNCSETKESCSAKSNTNFTAIWKDPLPGQCCGTCEMKPITDICTVVPLPNATVTSGNCTSIGPVAMEMCAGKCNTYQTSWITFANRPSLKKLGNKHCTCCAADKTHEETIQMVCNGVLQSAQSVRIDSCKCHHCDSVNNSDDMYSNDLFSDMD